MKLEEMAGTVNLSKKEQMIFDYVIRHREEAARDDRGQNWPKQQGWETLP